MKYIWRKHSHLKSSTSIIHPPVPRTTRHLEMHLCDRLGRFIRRAEANEAEALRGPRHGRFPLRPAMKNPEIPELRGTNKINQDLGMLSPKMWAFPKMWLFGTTWCKSLFNFTTVLTFQSTHIVIHQKNIPAVPVSCYCGKCFGEFLEPQSWEKEPGVPYFPWEILDV